MISNTNYSSPNLALTGYITYNWGKKTKTVDYAVVITVSNNGKQMHGAQS